MWINILLVGAGSMLGGVSRYLFAEGIKQLVHTTFPLGILVVNILGCFFIGLLVGALNSSGNFTEHHRMLFIIGFCGSFTTFSTFSADNFALLSSKAYLLSGLNIVLSVAGGLLATYVGYNLTRH